MQRIVYFHGLESQQGGKKIDLLTQSFLVYAPAIDYENPNIWKYYK